MPKVTPFLSPQRSGHDVTSARWPTFLRRLKDWLETRRRRQSLKKIPTELLNDVLPDGDTRTREELRRRPKRVETGLWY